MAARAPPPSARLRGAAPPRRGAQGPARSGEGGRRYASTAEDVAQLADSTQLLLSYLRDSHVQASRAITIGHTGEGRGLYAAEAVGEGAVLAVVPFDACLHAPVEGDEARDGALADSFWGMRLAANVVREHLRRAESPYAGYVACLPSTPPLPEPAPFADVSVDADGGGDTRAPREVDASGAVPHPMSFAWDDVKAIQYNEGRMNVDEWGYLSAQSFLRATADGDAVRATFGEGAHVPRALWDWAVSCVHSRTFGAELQGEGQPMDHYMVPLLDLLNHRGDETACEADATLVQAATELASSPPSAWTADALLEAARPLHALASLPRGPPYDAADNVEWIAEAANERFVCVAKRDIAQGEQLCVSYGERSNDDFFLYYAFVPPRNPHEDVVLFDSVEACLEWCANVFFNERYPDHNVGEEPPPEALEDIEKRADAARLAFKAAAAAARGGEDADPTSLDAARVDREPRLKVLAGTQYDARMLSAMARFFSDEQADAGALSAGAIEAAQARARARCAEVLAALPTTLADDLASLLVDELVGCASLESDGAWDAASGVAPAAGVLETVRLFGGVDGGDALALAALRRWEEGPCAALPASVRLALEYRLEKKLVLRQAAAGGGVV